LKKFVRSRLEIVKWHSVEKKSVFIRVTCLPVGKIRSKTIQGNYLPQSDHYYSEWNKAGIAKRAKNPQRINTSIVPKERNAPQFSV
jgi:hypothetical protein